MVGFCSAALKLLVLPFDQLPRAKSNKSLACLCLSFPLRKVSLVNTFKTSFQEFEVRLRMQGRLACSQRLPIDTASSYRTYLITTSRMLVPSGDLLPRLYNLGLDTKREGVAVGARIALDTGWKA
jgi:hypothetical protein